MHFEVKPLACRTAVILVYGLVYGAVFAPSGTAPEFAIDVAGCQCECCMDQQISETYGHQ